MLEIKKVQKQGSKISFHIKDVDISYINTLRRVIMSKVPVLAITSINIYENDSPIVDEILAHRLGLLPIKTDVKTYSKGNKAKFFLEVNGPCTVYSKDIKSVDPKVEIVNKNVPLTKLRNNDKLKLEMEAVMDSGATHARYQPCFVSYNQIKDNEFDFFIELNGSLSAEEIVSLAFSILKQDTQDFSKELKKIK